MIDLNAIPARHDAQASDITLNRVLASVFVFALVHSVFVLTMGIDEPLIGPHAFRQTQTALSAYWLEQGGPFFAYETPVLGAPWSTPFEFPFFQGLVALAGRTGLPLDPAGRAVSFAFFLLSLIPLRSLLRRLRLEGPTFIITATLLVSCPLLLFWSRAFLMESCAVFLGLLWLSLLARYLDERSPMVAVAGLVAGCLAVLVKSTTFVPFVFLCIPLVALRIVQRRPWRTGWPASMTVAITLAVLPLAVGYGWVAFTDHVKSSNELARHLTSEALVGWNLGTAAQKLSRALWIDTVWFRVLPDTLGLAFVAGLLAIGASVASPRHLWAAVMSTIAFLLPFVLFTNLHIVHDYYQAANAVFLIVAVGISLSCMVLGPLRPLGVMILLVIVAGQLAFFYLHFYPSTQIVGSDSRLYRIAAEARERTDPTQSLIVIGDDWSSTIPYYAQRKSLAVPSWAPGVIIEKLITDPQSLLGDYPLGAIVFCSDHLGDYREHASDLSRFASSRTVLTSVDGCMLLGQAH